MTNKPNVKPPNEKINRRAFKNKVRKAVIPAAGLGTRFLPTTKAIHKEMLPLVDIPTIQVMVQEALVSGIEEILLISTSKKTALENHFGRDLAFEEQLRHAGKNELADQLKAIGTMATLPSSIRKIQKA